MGLLERIAFVFEGSNTAFPSTRVALPRSASFRVTKPAATYTVVQEAVNASVVRGVRSVLLVGALDLAKQLPELGQEHEHE